MPGADLASATTRGAGAFVAPAPRAVRPARDGARLDVDVDVAIIGGGCSGLATAARLAEAPGRPSVLVLEGRTGRDPRSWCSWDDGGDPLPEARSASWTQWEVRTDDGVSLGVDPAHPYVLVRAEDRRAAAQRRLDAAGNVRLVAGSPVSRVTGDGQALVVGTNGAPVRAATVLDARGPRCPETVPHGNVLLHQRFVGRWVTTTRPVFDPRTVTLMDFSGSDQSSAVRFVYVLPVSETSALVESTAFTPDAADPFDHRAAVDEYLRRRWGLAADEWRVDDEEVGCIPMTDVAPERLAGADDPRWHPAGDALTAAIVGTTRPSSGYGFARSNRHSAVVARHLADGTPVPAFVDRRRTCLLDAVFLRFLRDRPDGAAEAFRRLFALPGPLVVRFMSERSTLADDVRIVLALQKRPFLAALLRTVAEGLVRVRSARRGRA